GPRRSPSPEATSFRDILTWSCLLRLLGPAGTACGLGRHAVLARPPIDRRRRGPIPVRGGRILSRSRGNRPRRTGVLFPSWTARLACIDGFTNLPASPPGGRAF